ncbi:MAG: hypothetical protein ACPGIA_09105 [Luteolibacter sp.]
MPKLVHSTVLRLLGSKATEVEIFGLSVDGLPEHDGVKRHLEFVH